MSDAQKSSAAPAEPFISLGLRRRLVSVGIHTALFSLSLLLSFGLAFNFRSDPAWFTRMFLVMLPFALGVKLVVFGLRGEYDVSWRYVSLRDLVNVTIASHISVVVFILGYFVVANLYTRLYGEALFTTVSADGKVVSDFRQSIFLLDWAGTIALVGGARMVVRLYHEEIAPASSSSRTRLLIVGAGNAGESVLREILRMREDRYEVVGFVDDDSAKQGVRIHGVEVLGPTRDLKEIAKAYDVEEILIAIPSATRKQLRRVIELCEGTALGFRTVPGIDELIDGKVTVSQIRKVRIEDLLGRDPVRLDLDLIGQYIQGRIVLVTGAGGSIGSEMCRQICRFEPRSLVLVEQAENPLFDIERELRHRFPGLQIASYIADITDARRVRRIFSREKPAVIFHAAAHKHVPMMEQHAGEAVKNNVLGSRTVADAAVETGVEKFVMISTDKAVNPTSVMGCTKRVAEMYIQELSHRSKTQFVTVRFGNVLGSSGSVVPIFRDQIDRGGPVTVTHPDMCRYFMMIPEASSLVLQAGAMGKGGEVFVLDMGEPVKIVDLARQMIMLSGLRPGEDIEVRFTGIRPGEKLYEELSVSGEDFAQTGHEKIFVWRHRREDWDSVCRAIDKLIAMADSARPDEIRAMLATIVPEYDPQKWHQYAGQKDPQAVATTDSGPGADIAVSPSLPNA
jgi:FlaA1/EpsC-like NDP-sugar epimerase